MLTGQQFILPDLQVKTQVVSQIWKLGSQARFAAVDGPGPIPSSKPGRLSAPLCL